MSSEKKAIDDDLYSRVQYALGEEAMRKITESTVLIIGMGGLGCEVAKNLILTGVGKLTIADRDETSMWDLGSMFVANEKDVGQPRAAVASRELSKLHPTGAPLTVLSEVPNTAAELQKYDSVIWCDQTYPLSNLIDINNAIRSTTKMTWCEARGVAGFIFNDFGPQHTVLDDTGIDPVTHTVTEISTSQVTVDDENQLLLYPDDTIKFDSIPDTLFRIEKILSASSFAFTPAVDLTSGNPGYLTQVKIPKKLPFISLAEALQRDPCSGIAAGDLTTDLTVMRKLFDESRSEQAMYLQASFNPITCYIGGLGAQEVLKACTGKYSPIHQLYYYDGRDVVPKVIIEANSTHFSGKKDRYCSTTAVLGTEVTTRLKNNKVFMIGCGALGCEFIKNFACLGIGTGPKGFLTATDPDKIERSNLTRQFLFRNEHVGQFKSKIAQSSAKRINPTMKMMAKTSRVGTEQEQLFNDRFWNKQDILITALDNVQARLYVDTKALQFSKKMIDSGTLGPQAHSQVVIPKQTENYGAQRDPPEKDIPQCTLHFFPNSKEHTIAWARDWFGGSFEATYSLMDGVKGSDTLGKEQESQLSNLISCLKEEQTPETCIRWGIEQFKINFTNSMKQILKQHPIDKVDDKTGQPFWSGKLKAPRVVEFDPTNEMHSSFVKAVGRVRAAMFCLNLSQYDTFTSSVDLSEYNSLSPPPVDQTSDEYQALLLLEWDKVKHKASSITLSAIEFDKDENTQGHIACITAAANLRSHCYGIPLATHAEVKKISGRIIPAMVTTTALITGLVCVEFLKLLQDDLPLEKFCNSWINVAVPQMMSSDPEPPTPKLYLTDVSGSEVGPGKEERDKRVSAVFKSHILQKKTWTPWDRLEISSKGDATLRQLFSAVEANYGISISQLATTNGDIIFSEFNPLHTSDLFQEMGFSKPVAELVSKVTSRSLEDIGNCIEFVIKGKVSDDIYLGELPLLRYKIKSE